MHTKITATVFPAMPAYHCRTFAVQGSWGLNDQFKIILGDIRQPPEELGSPFDLVTMYNNNYYFSEAERPALFDSLPRNPGARRGDSYCLKFSKRWKGFERRKPEPGNKRDGWMYASPGNKNSQQPTQGKWLRHSRGHPPVAWKLHLHAGRHLRPPY